jgi:hypothetical protein
MSVDSSLRYRTLKIQNGDLAYLPEDFISCYNALSVTLMAMTKCSAGSP